MTRLADLGPRICIMGPSNSGKSNLAVAIGRKKDLTPIHLDQLYHQPNTHWLSRPEKEFIALHDEMLGLERWVMDGNYSRSLPQRLTRATGFILLDTSTATSLLRYLRRSWFEGSDRPGALEGAQDKVSWAMIHHIVVTTRKNRRRYKTMFEEIPLPKIRLATARQITEFYQTESLVRVDP